VSPTPSTSRTDRRATLAPTVHQAVEYVVGLLLAYTAIHRTASTTVALFAVAAGAIGIALLSPGALGVRPVFSHRVRRAADVVLALLGVAATIAVTRVDLFATGPLLLAALIFVRLGVSRLPQPVVRRPRRRQNKPSRPSVATRAGHMVGDIQPLMNRTARAAGTFVRNRRTR
jgi:hypothetical protein